MSDDTRIEPRDNRDDTAPPTDRHESHDSGEGQVSTSGKTPAPIDGAAWE